MFNDQCLMINSNGQWLVGPKQWNDECYGNSGY